MEVALEVSLPTYSGGLGVLAGDTLRSAADLGLPMVGVTLLGIGPEVVLRRARSTTPAGTKNRSDQ